MAEDIEESKQGLVLHRLYVPDAIGFHGSLLQYDDNKYICIYHNTYQHRIGSCFVDKDFKYIDGSNTEDLGISYFIDPRTVKHNGKYYVSTSRLHYGPETIHLWLLNITDKITIDRSFVIAFSSIKEWPSYQKDREKNWTPWDYKGRFFYTYSLNPHRILEVDIEGDGTAKLIAETSWTGDLLWDKHEWVTPKYRLNTPPIQLNDGTYLSTFHTMCMKSLSTPWHRIQPNHLLSYWTGFFQFEGQPPFKVIKVSYKPFMTPNYILPEDWPFQYPPSGGNPFYPFSMMLRGDDVILNGGSNEVAVAYCTIPLGEILDSMREVKST